MKENSVIAEGLVPLRVPGLDFTGLGVLRRRCRPSGSLAAWTVSALEKFFEKK